MSLPKADQITSLFHWSPTPSFKVKVDVLMQNVSDEELLVKSSESAKWLRKAFVLGRFAAGLGASDCRLVDGQFPDAEIRTHDIVKKLEITELMDPKRKRSAEYKSGAKAIHIDHNSLRRNSEHWIYWFVERVFEKSGHYFQGCTHCW